MKNKPFLLLLWGLIAASVLSADVTLLANNDSLLIPDVSCRTEGKIIKVTDGDTVNVLDTDKTTHKIRLAGIDAPEIGQAYGQTARKFLAKHINQKNRLRRLAQARSLRTVSWSDSIRGQGC